MTTWNEHRDTLSKNPKYNKEYINVLKEEWYNNEIDRLEKKEQELQQQLEGVPHIRNLFDALDEGGWTEEELSIFYARGDLECTQERLENLRSNRVRFVLGEVLEQLEVVREHRTWNLYAWDNLDGFEFKASPASPGKHWDLLLHHSEKFGDLAKVFPSGEELILEAKRLMHLYGFCYTTWGEENWEDGGVRAQHRMSGVPMLPRTDDVLEGLGLRYLAKRKEESEKKLSPFYRSGVVEHFSKPSQEHTCSYPNCEEEAKVEFGLLENFPIYLCKRHYYMQRTGKPYWNGKAWTYEYDIEDN